MPVTATRRFVVGAALATAAAARVGTLASNPPADPYAGGTVIEGDGVRSTMLWVTDAAFGAVGDGVLLNDLAVSAGSTSLSSATAPFVSTEHDQHKIVYWLGADDSIGSGVIASVQSTTRATLASPARVSARADGGPNTNGGFGTDNTVAFNKAFTSAQAAAEDAAADRRPVVLRVEVRLPRGVFFTRALTPFQQSGVMVSGEGRFATLVASGEKGAWLSMSTYASNPSNAFLGTATDWTFRDIQFVNPCSRNGSTEGKRVGRAIQDNGSGGVRVLRCGFTGLEYGFCGAYGSDFTQIAESNFYLCDTGYYFGPGSQQLDIVKTDAALCREGAVFEGAPHWHIGGTSSFEDPKISAITVEARSAGSTRLGVPVAISGAFYSGTFLVDGATWFETNSGGNGRVCPRMILVRGDGPFNLPVQGLTVRDAYLIAGGTRIENGTNCFVEYDSALLSPEPVLIENLVIGGDFINAVFRMTGSAKTSSPRLSSITRPSGVDLLLGRTSGAKVLERDGSMIWPVEVSAPAGDAMAITIRRRGDAAAGVPLLAALAPSSDDVLSGIASGGGLVEAFRSSSSSGGTLTVDASSCNYFSCALTGPITGMSITNPPATASQRLTVELSADASARSVRWAADCRFAGGTPPTSVAARTRLSVTFSWHPQARLWFETGRATGIPA